ncbi:MAG: DUF2062 domain-containing protein [Deltaproteobacteria bacterium]|nr:DUF2062 domain-containing protein [Deltaproteobacteria bacterium]
MPQESLKSENNGWSKRHPLVKLRRRARLLYLRILRLGDPPERIARGAAIGVAMGVLPTFGAGGVLALILAFVFRANKAAAVIASAIVNPLTAPFFWTASIIIGGLATGADSAAILAKWKGENLLAFAEEATVVYMAGNAIITIVLTVASYFLVKWAIVKHRERKAKERGGSR